MARKVRVQFRGAVYHVMSRGDRHEAIFLDDIDRLDFIKTLAKCCRKTGFQVHAYCLMSKSLPLGAGDAGTQFGRGHSLVRQCLHHSTEPPAQIVRPRFLASQARLESVARAMIFASRLRCGRYKAVLVQHDGGDYFRTGCDYVHLNPVRAKLLAQEERILSYPWSSLGSYIASPAHRPSWVRVERYLSACD